MSVGGEPVCPTCRDDSSIVKVSGVHRAHSTNLTSSQLAELLVPPSEDVRGLAGVDGGRILGSILGLVVGFAIGLMIGDLFAIVVGSVLASVIGQVIGGVIGGIAASKARQKRRPEYLRLLEKWERAYYYQKHDLVFLPGDDWAGSPTDFRGLMSCQ